MKTLWVKWALICTLFAVAALCLLGPPLGGVSADPPDPTPTPAVSIGDELGPYQAPGAEPPQSDGRLLEEASPPSEVEDPPVVAQDQRTLYSIADAAVLQGYASTNLGRAADMWAGYDDYLNPDGRIARSLVRFDIASLPADVCIIEATLRLRLVSSYDYPYRRRTITTYRITGSWSESGVTWNNRPGYGEAYGSENVVHRDWDWYEFDVTDLVAAWHDGTYTNRGIMLRGPEVSGADSSWRGFGTRESQYRPQLVVEYDTLGVDSITPTSGANNGVVHATMRGTCFQSGATVRLTRSGQSDIVATSVSVVGSTRITCNLNLAGAATGTWNVVVTNPGGQSTTLPNGFTVKLPPPRVDGISPNTGVNNGSVSATITGAYFQSGATVKLRKTGRPDIVATNVSVVSTRITCDLDLVGAATGTWNVVVTNPDGQSDTLLGRFTVTAPPPRVDSIAPNTGPNNDPVSVTITGACFQSGATVRLTKSGQTIVATNTNVPSSTRITCDLDLDGAETGAWDVVVANRDGQSGTLSNGFTVTEAEYKIYLPAVLKNASLR